MGPGPDLLVSIVTIEQTDEPVPGAIREHEGRLPVGTRVEIRRRFDQEWARGFTVDTVEADGYRVLRVSDDFVLPVVFAIEEVRRERKRSMWWV